MASQDSPDDRIEYICTNNSDYTKTWSNEEEMQQLNSSLKICCVPLPRRAFFFVKYVAPTLLLLVSFAADLISGAAVAVRHFRDGHTWWGGLTLAFMCAPVVLFVAHAIVKTLRSPDMHLKKKLLWIVLYLFTGGGLLLWPLWGYVKKVVFAVRAFFDEENSTIHIEKFHSIGEVTDNMHNMLKAFLQSAPQLLLQMYILISSAPGEQDTVTVVTEVISILFSLNSLTIVIVELEVNSKHHPSRSSPHPSSHPSDLCCVAVEYLWWLCSVTARVLALALFASVFRYWVFLICAIHSLTLSTCLVLHRPPGKSLLDGLVVALFMGVVYVFCFVEYKVDFGALGRVAGLYVVYYAFTFVQNVCMVMSAYFLSGGGYLYHLPLVVVHFVCFFLGVVLMLFYLGLLRPFYLGLLKKADPPSSSE